MGAEDALSEAQPVGTSATAEETLGKYRIIRRLAFGGMAEILLARHSGIEGFEKLVVLKRILPQYACDGHFIRMFLQEARLAATLHHSNIAQVYEVGKVSDTYFFAMEYIHGVDVRQLFRAARARGGPLPLDQAISIVVAVAAGLHYAHEARDQEGQPLAIVHRDVSPSNILVGYDGNVKLVDFGVARMARQHETRPGTIKGKVAYMSPEQCQGLPLDRRSDVFALGIVLYELTTGRRLFADEEDDFAVLRKIIGEPIPLPRARLPGFPAALEPIVMRALEKDVARRYPNAQALQLDLEAFATEHKLGRSSVMMERYLESLFPRDAAAWQKARATGQSLVDLARSRGGFTSPIGEGTRAGHVEAASVTGSLGAGSVEITRTESGPAFDVPIEEASPIAHAPTERAPAPVLPGDRQPKTRSESAAARAKIARAARPAARRASWAGPAAGLAALGLASGLVTARFRSSHEERPATAPPAAAPPATAPAPMPGVAVALPKGPARPSPRPAAALPSVSPPPAAAPSRLRHPHLRDAPSSTPAPTIDRDRALPSSAATGPPARPNLGKGDILEP